MRSSAAMWIAWRYPVSLSNSPDDHFRTNHSSPNHRFLLSRHDLTSTSLTSLWSHLLHLRTVLLHPRRPWLDSKITLTPINGHGLGVLDSERRQFVRLVDLPRIQVHPHRGPLGSSTKARTSSLQRPPLRYICRDPISVGFRYIFLAVLLISSTAWYNRQKRREGI
jgi:hypothetical protein